MRPFREVSVLDFTQVIAGPLSTQLLAALGADVVKVEPPDGDAARGMLGGAKFPCFNLEKRSIALDLKTDGGRAVARELAADADVIVENFRPGVMERFGLDYESVAAENGDVVYCSITGFGQEGPYANRPAFDSIMQAASGLMAMTGHPDAGPARIPAPLVDQGTAAYTAFLVASAVLERELTGAGEHVEIALYDVAVQYVSGMLARHAATGRLPECAGSGSYGIAPSDVFFAAGGEPFYLTAPYDGIFRRLCSVIDREDLASDERFRTGEARWEHRGELAEELGAAFETRERGALIEELAANGVPAGPFYDIGELPEDPHVRRRGLTKTARTPDGGSEVRMARPPIRTSDGVPELGERPPGLGEHGEEILAALGYSGAEIEDLMAGGAVRPPEDPG